MTRAANGAINRQINYQAKLLDSSGLPVADGNYQLKFSLYDASTGGSRLWAATGTLITPTALTVAVQNGLFTVPLGDTSANGGWQNPLNDAVSWNSDSLFLGITVGADAEMTPRKRLTAAPQAFNSEMLQGMYASSSVFGANSLFTIHQTSNTAATGTRSTLDIRSEGTSDANDFLLRGINDLGGTVLSVNRSGYVTTTGLLIVTGAGTSTISNNLYVGNNVTTTNLFTTGLSAATGNFGNATSTNFYATNFNAASFNPTGITWMYATGTYTTSTNLFATYGSFTTATGTTFNATNLNSGNATLTGGTINGVTIGATTPSSGVFTNVTSTSATSTNFYATNLSAGSFNPTGITWTYATGTQTTSTYLYANYFTAANFNPLALTWGSATGTNLDLLSGQIRKNNISILNVTTTSVALGSSALNSNINGSYSVAIGREALNAATSSQSNTAVGDTALRSNTYGQDNTALGASALSANTTGDRNVGIGYAALRRNTTGTRNTAVGYEALDSNLTGNDNVALGYFALEQNKVGNDNVGVGRNALQGNVTGTQNVAIGIDAGNATTNGSENNNTFIGYGTGLDVAGVTNGTAIGYNARVSRSNSLILGGTGVNVGVGTSTPSLFKLQVAGDVGPDANNLYDLGSATYSWRNIFASGTAYLANVTSTNVTSTNLFAVNGTITNLTSGNAALTGGTINNMAIGGITPSTGVFTDVTSTNATTTSLYATIGQIDNLTSGNAILSGGTIDNMTIGGVTPAIGIFTEVTTTSLFATTASTTSLGVGAMASGLIPDASLTYDLGSSANKWNGLYAGGVTIDGSLSTLRVSSNLTPLTNNFRDLGAGLLSWRNLYVSSTAYFGGNLIPSVNNSQDIGSPTFSWNNIYASGTANLGGNIMPSVNASQDIGSSIFSWNNIYVSGTANLGGNIMPSINNSQDIGSPTLSWRNFYASGTAVFGSTSTFSGPIDGIGKIPATTLANIATNNTYAVSVQGRYAYTVSNDGASTRLFVRDVSNPASPITLGSDANALGTARSLFVQGKYAYVAHNDDLSIFDVSNPKVPTRIADTTSGLNEAMSVYVQGRYAFVVSSGTSAMVVFDIADPANPVQVSNVSSWLTNPIAVFVQGRYAYITSNDTIGGGGRRLVIYDVSKPTNPVFVSQSDSVAQNDPYGLYVQGRYAYATYYNGGSNGYLYIYDVKDPSTVGGPVGALSFGGSGCVPNYYSNLYVQGKYAYVSCANDDSLTVVNVSNPSLLLVVGRVSDSATTGARSVYVQGRYAYLAGVKFATIDLNGAYLQQVEIGGLETGTLAVKSNAQFYNNLDVRGGAEFSEGIAVHNTSSFYGGLAIGSGNNYLHSSGTASSLVVGAGGTDHVAEFRNTGLYLPKDDGTYSMYSKGGLYVGLGATAFSYFNGYIQFTAAAGAGANTLCQDGSGFIILCASSRSLKDNIMDLGLGLDTVKQLQPVKFNWKQTGQQDLGFIAEDVAAVNPLLALYTATGTLYGVKYPQLTALLTSAIQEQQVQIDPLVNGISVNSGFSSTTHFMTVDAAGNVTMAAGDLTVAGKIYPGTRTGVQHDKYIFLDDSAAPTSTYIATNADGWQSNTSYDFAERYYSPDQLEAGDLVVVSDRGTKHVQRSLDEKQILAGVVSTKPAFMAGAPAPSSFPIALLGRVPTKVSTIKGAIKAGDMLAPSSIPGVAVKAATAGPVVGQALEAYDGADVGKIEVFIRPIWWGGDEASKPIPNVVNQYITQNINPLPSATTSYSGFAQVSMGAAKVHVSFASLGAYPMVQATPRGEVDGGWWTDNVTDMGFDIIIKQAQAHDVIFAWRAEATALGAQANLSDGTLVPVDPTTGLIMIPQLPATTSTPVELSSTPTVEATTSTPETVATSTPDIAVTSTSL